MKIDENNIDEHIKERIRSFRGGRLEFAYILLYLMPKEHWEDSDKIEEYVRQFIPSGRD